MRLLREGGLTVVDEAVLRRAAEEFPDRFLSVFDPAMALRLYSDASMLPTTKLRVGQQEDTPPLPPS